jgi:hypothetical protein
MTTIPLEKELIVRNADDAENILGRVKEKVRYTVEYVSGRRCHIFQCSAKNCKGSGQGGRGVRRFLDKGDARSTSNLRKHARKCWGDDVVTAADNARNADEVRATKEKANLNPNSITAAFEWNGMGKVTYSHRQHTKTESRWGLKLLPSLKS